MLIALLFTLVHVRQSMDGGRLALPPTFDDVGYMHDAQVRLHVFYDQGPAAAWKHAIESPPHSPWSALLAVSAFTLFGLRDWAPAAANGVIVLGVLGWLAWRARRLPLTWQLIAGGSVLTWPLMGQAVVNFRPDLACGLATAGCALYVARDRWVDAPGRRHYAAGIAFGLALLIKPTISPVTALIVVTALAAATLTDVARRPAQRRWRPIAAAWARCLGTGAALAALYYLVAAGQTWAYIYRNTFGRLADVWKLELSASEQALFYLTGDGGRFALAGWLELWIVLAVAALLAAIARRDRHALARLPAVAAVLIVGYLAVTLPAHKHLFLGSVLPSLMLLAGIEMMVYLAAAGDGGLPWWRRREVAGRLVLVALLVAGAWGFQWPIRLTPGGPLPRQEAAQHHELLEDLYRDLRRLGREDAQVVFAQVGGYLSGPVLEYRAGVDGALALRGLHGLDLGHSAPFEEEMARTDFVVFFSEDNPNVLRWLPDAGSRQRALDGVRDDPGFRLAGTYPTPGGGEAFLYARVDRFSGVEGLDGLGPVEGPYPEWGLHFPVRWAMGPSTRFEIEIPPTGRAVLILDGRASFPDQSMTVEVAGESVHVHRFAAQDVFERIEVELDLAPGPQVVELAHSHWHPADAADERQRAVLLRMLAAFPRGG